MSFVSSVAAGGIAGTILPIPGVGTVTGMAVGAFANLTGLDQAISDRISGPSATPGQGASEGRGRG